MGGSRQLSQVVDAARRYFAKSLPAGFSSFVQLHMACSYKLILHNPTDLVQYFFKAGIAVSELLIRSPL